MIKFQPGNLVVRKPNCLTDPFWNIRQVREYKGVGGVYEVVSHVANSLLLVGLSSEFDARKFDLVLVKKDLSEYL